MLSLSPFPNPTSLSPPIKAPHFHGILLPFKPSARRFHSVKRKTNSSIIAKAAASEQQQQENFQVLTASRSEYNNIVILESQNCKVLLLDDSGNVHSILYKDQKWTKSYWDEFCSLPAIIPQGPVAVFGLGGGTVAHQLLHFWPALHVEGWELDDVLIDRAREYFDLSDLEISNDSGGVLKIFVGDALSPLANVQGGYAGIVVDLFSEAKVLPQLERPETWLEMSKKLMPNGRIMVNCGAANASPEGEASAVGQEWQVNSTIKAMCRALGGNLVNWKKMPEYESGNYLAFTGSLADLDVWSESVPQKLGAAVKYWRPCEPL